MRIYFLGSFSSGWMAWIWKNSGWDLDSFSSGSWWRPEGALLVEFLDLEECLGWDLGLGETVLNLSFGEGKDRIFLNFSEGTPFSREALWLKLLFIYPRPRPFGLLALRPLCSFPTEEQLVLHWVELEARAKYLVRLIISLYPLSNFLAFSLSLLNCK